MFHFFHAKHFFVENAWQWIFLYPKNIFSGEFLFFLFMWNWVKKNLMFFSFFKNSTCDIHLECVEHISANLNTFPAKRNFSPDFFVTRFHTWKENSPGNLFFSLGLTQFFPLQISFCFLIFTDGNTNWRNSVILRIIRAKHFFPLQLSSTKHSGENNLD